jgi:hypothetical protein
MATANRSTEPQANVDLSSSRKASATPHLPNERDEKVGATGGVPSERIKQGAKDVTRGVTDTSRAPEADAAYRKLKR